MVPNRQGDVPHSLADISKAKNILGYYPKYDVKQGLKESNRMVLEFLSQLKIYL